MLQARDMVLQERKLTDAWLFSSYPHTHEEGMIQVQMQLVPVRNSNCIL